jgi:uncharacterized protein (TIGR00725 family)
MAKQGMKIKIGVMGSASGPTLRDSHAIAQARRLGEAIARRGCILITGACPGLPDKAAEGARRCGGFVFGISPAFSRREHLEIYGSPIEQYDMILYSGMGLMERDIVNIRSSDAIAIVGGGVGSLNEFTVAYEEHKPIGVVTGTGGLSDHVREILAFVNRRHDGDRVLYDDDPERLVDRLLALAARVTPPLRESDIGGEREAPSYMQVEKTRRRQRRVRDRVTQSEENHGNSGKSRGVARARRAKR